MNINKEFIQISVNNIKDANILLSYLPNASLELSETEEVKISDYNIESYIYLRNKMALIMIVDICLEQTINAMRYYYMGVYNINKEKLYHNPSVILFAFHEKDIPENLKENMINTINLRNKFQHEDLSETMKKEDVIDYANSAITYFYKCNSYVQEKIYKLNYT